ncbi:hypothetical protein MKZ38_010098 [Zalerion maritima]|uniref:Armadillo-like helical domain-containing protein n=1 Tax=Zalerion maritima TaxID=339359 RepID=A0AAD5WMY3_9PEZI|nr:hypothetical protein MKZ38_010098 [Zalerion maritima]
MEPSPLTQQARPEVFQQKIVQLYEQLFIVDDDEQTEGFWKEFFLLKPDRLSLRRILEEESPDDLLNYPQSRQLFTRAVACLRSESSSRANADLHALDTLTTFLSCVLDKKYTNPSSDVINVLVGLEEVDAVFTDFVSALDNIIRAGRSLELRQKAVQVALAVTSGAWSTTLLTYFIQRDLFMGITNFIQDSDTPSRAADAFILLGMLANYNKFEFQNPYQMRLSDFVNERAIRTIIATIGAACQQLRACYVDVHDDVPEGWTLSNTLGIIGLRSIAPGASKAATTKSVYDDETAKKMFSLLPMNQAAILLSTFDFAHLNKLFCTNLVVMGSTEKGAERPLASYISLTSYILQHAYLSGRATQYAHLNLMAFRLLIEDPILCKALCSTTCAPIRMCRQRQPLLPQITMDRPLICYLLDLMVDGVNHNLRRRLDVGLYTLCVGILLRIISYLSRTRCRLQYHWAELWRSLLSLVRFLGTYANDISGLPQVETLLDHVVNLVALSLSAGEAFLPGPAAYDDLFYKVVETHDVLLKFRDAYSLGKRPSNSIGTLIGVGQHYRRILEENAGKKRLGKLDTLQMAAIIKEGYETLSIQTKEGLDRWEKFREPDERVLLKKVAREAVTGVKSLVRE